MKVHLMPNFNPRVTLALMVVLMLGLSLSACGKKPRYVDPPDGVEDDKFPLKYPDPATDPGYVPPVQGQNQSKSQNK